MLAVPLTEPESQKYRAGHPSTVPYKDEMMKKRNSPAITWITTCALLLSMCASLTLGQRTAAQSGKPDPEQSALQYPNLSKYAIDLTLLALQGKLPMTNERDADVARVIASLANAERTPVLVGESDLDRNIVARGVSETCNYARHIG